MHENIFIKLLTHCSTVLQGELFEVLKRIRIFRVFYKDFCPLKRLFYIFNYCIYAWKIEIWINHQFRLQNKPQQIRTKLIEADKIYRFTPLFFKRTSETSKNSMKKYFLRADFWSSCSTVCRLLNIVDL